MALTIINYAVKCLLYILENMNGDCMGNLLAIVSYANSSIRKVNMWQIISIYIKQMIILDYATLIMISKISH